MGDTLIVNGKEIRIAKLAANSWKPIGMPIEHDDVLYGCYITNSQEKVAVKL